MLIHCELHPVVATTIASTRASRAFDLELSFMVSPWNCWNVVNEVVGRSLVVG